MVRFTFLPVIRGLDRNTTAVDNWLDTWWISTAVKNTVLTDSNNKNKLSSQPGAVHNWSHFYKQQRFCPYIYDVTRMQSVQPGRLPYKKELRLSILFWCIFKAGFHIGITSQLPFLEASFSPLFLGFFFKLYIYIACFWIK